MRILALDVGKKRIGLAYADSNIRIAVSRGMLAVDGQEFAHLAKRLDLDRIDLLLSGLPRNNSGETTRQTAAVQEFIANFEQYLRDKGQKLPLFAFQDESWTSEVAKDHLVLKKHQISRRDRDSGAVDAEAATIILQDFLEGQQLKIYEQKITK